MARYDWYILRIWRSGHRRGEQWAARLEHMPDGESVRFNQPDLLLDHLRQLLRPTARGKEQPPPDEERPRGRGEHETEPR